MAKIINLNRHRKKAAEELDKARAERNRVRHGRTKAQKQEARLERLRAEHELDEKRIDAGPSADEGDDEG